MQNDGEFSKFVKEFGSNEAEEEQEREDEEVAIEGEDEDAAAPGKKKERKKAVAGTGLMLAEERNTGAISWSVYKTYSRAGKGAVVLPFWFLSILFLQGATVMGSYWCVSVSGPERSTNSLPLPGLYIGKKCEFQGLRLAFVLVMTSAQEMGPPTGILCKWHVCLIFLCSDHSDRWEYMLPWVPRKLWPRS